MYLDFLISPTLLSQHHLEICPGRGCGYNQVSPVFYACVLVLSLPESISILQKELGKVSLKRQGLYFLSHFNVAAGKILLPRIAFSLFLEDV